MVYNARPEGCDAYGAVQAGRIMCSVASAYSLIAQVGVFSEEEYTFFEQMVDYFPVWRGNAHVAVCACGGTKQGEDSDHSSGREKMISKIYFSVTDYGAKSDGSTKDTAAI